MFWTDHNLFAGLIFWGAIVLFVFIGNFFSYKRRASRDRLLEKLAEKGLPLPPELFSDRDGGSCRHPFTTSFVLMAAGVAIALFFWAMTGGSSLFAGEPGVPKWLPIIGVFPFLIGIARLLGAAFDKRRGK